MNRVPFDGLPREEGAPDSGTLQVTPLIWKYRPHVTEVYEFDDTDSQTALRNLVGVPWHRSTADRGCHPYRKSNFGYGII